MKDLNEPTSFQVNLRRLLFFHHASAREAAKTIGVAEQAVSGWLRGKRQPSGPVLLRIAEIYDIDPRSLSGDQYAFAEDLGRAVRIRTAERNIQFVAAGKPVPESARLPESATVTELRPRGDS